jgi:kinesin family protein 20
VGPEELEGLQREKEAVYRLGLELLRTCGRASPDISVLSGVSAASTASSASLASLAATGDPLDLTRLASLFPGLPGRDREGTTIEVPRLHLTLIAFPQIHHSNISYSVWISFAEIYNENIHDLFQKVPASKKKRPSMKLCDDRLGNTYVKGLREVRVNSADEAYQALMIGRENLHFAATKLNQQSSRSHCIFTIKLVKVADPAMPHLARVSILSFCDLAGSERISKTHNVGERLKEAGNINTSLLVLGRCIKAIRHNQTVKEKEKKPGQTVQVRGGL